MTIIAEDIVINRLIETLDVFKSLVRTVTGALPTFNRNIGCI